MTSPPPAAAPATGRELSLVLPAYNSAAYIGRNVGRVLDFLAAEGIAGEVIVADDGSNDGTAAAVPTAGNVSVLRLPHRGKGGALRAGMQAAQGEICAFTDADLPYGLQPLPVAMRWIRERRYHAVVGDRTLPGATYESHGQARAVLSGMASFVFRTIVTGGIYDTQCGLKAFRGDVARELFRIARVDGFAIDVEILYLMLKYRLDIKRLPVQLESTGPSSVRVVRDSARAVRDVVSIRTNWARARYRSRYLDQVLRADLEFEAQAAAGR